MATEPNEPSLLDLLDRADDGDAAAKATLNDLGADVAALGGAFAAKRADWAERLTRPAIDPEALEDLGDTIAAEKRAAVEREQAMIAELTATRRALEAEQGRSRVMVRVTMATGVFGAVSAIAAVVAIF